MNFLGLGGFEILLIGAIALFVLGPKRLLEAIREGRKVFRDLKRQRDTLQKMIVEAIDLEDLKKQIDVDGLEESAKSLENDLALERVGEEVQKATDAAGSISLNWRSANPTVEVDPNEQNTALDVNLPGGVDTGSEPKQKLALEQEPQQEADNSPVPDEPKS